MATTQNITSSYAGKDAGVYISAAIKSADTIDKGALEILPNIKYKSVIHQLETADGTVDFACDFTPGGSVTLSEAVLEPKKVMLPLELCKENFVNTWEAESMGLGATNENLPVPFADYLIANILEKQSAKIDKDIWQGVASNSGEFDGFIPLWVADASVVKVATPEAITAANVIAKLGDTLDAVSDEVLGKADVKFIISANVARAYGRALSALGYQNDFSVGAKPLNFEGFELEVIGGLPSNTMAVYQKSNAYFGTGLMSDMNEISILDMKEHDLSDNVRFKMVYTAGVQYVVGEDIVLYTV